MKMQRGRPDLGDLPRQCDPTVSRLVHATKVCKTTDKTPNDPFMQCQQRQQVSSRCSVHCLGVQQRDPSIPHSPGLCVKPKVAYMFRVLFFTLTMPGSMLYKCGMPVIQGARLIESPCSINSP